MLMSNVNRNDVVISSVKKVHKVEVLTRHVKRRDVSCENWFMKLFFGEDIIKVEQRLRFFLKDEIITTDEIVDITEDPFNNVTGANYLNFICADGTIYETVFNVEDTTDTLEEIYFWAREERPEFVFSKISNMKCFRTLKQVCFIPIHYVFG